MIYRRNRFSLMLLGVWFIVFSACKAVSPKSQLSETIVGEKPELIRQPYVQMIRPETATITWKTDASAKQCFVKILEVSKDKELVFQGNLTSHENQVFNEVTLNDLKPETTYLYAIYSNGHLLAKGEDYYFKTAPNDKKTAFSFYALGDIGAKEKGSFAKEPANRIVELDTKPDFGLGLGDIVYPKGESKNYDNHLFKPFKEVFKNTPFYPVAGNHDWLSDNHNENFKKEWYLPDEEYYYSFSFSNTLFIGLDSRDGNFYDYDNQAKWLENTLKSNQNKYDWIVVFLHHNGKTCTYKRDYDHVINLYATFAEYNVDLVLNGHAHTYERLKPYDGFGNVDTAVTDQNTYEDLKNRFISITIGAGGKINKKWEANPENEANCQDGSIVAHYEHVPSFGLVSIDRKTLRFEGVNSFTGKIFDFFTLKK